jgi:hypothetical protein
VTVHETHFRLAPETPQLSDRPLRDPAMHRIEEDVDANRLS